MILYSPLLNSCLSYFLCISKAAPTIQVTVRFVWGFFFGGGGVFKDTTDESPLNACSCSFLTLDDIPRAILKRRWFAFIFSSHHVLFVHLASSLDVIKRETTSAREFLKSCIAVKYRACTLHNSASNKDKMATSGFFEFFQLFF